MIDYSIMLWCCPYKVYQFFIFQNSIVPTCPNNDHTSIKSCNHHLIAATPRQISPMSLFLRRRSFNWTTFAMRLSFRSSRAHFFMSLAGLRDTTALDEEDDDPKGILTAVRRIRRWHRFSLLLFLLLLNLFIWLFDFLLDALGVQGCSWLPLLPFQKSGKPGKPGTPPPLTVFSPLSCIDSTWQFGELIVTEVAVDFRSGDAAVLM